MPRKRSPAREEERQEAGGEGEESLSAGGQAQQLTRLPPLSLSPSLLPTLLPPRMLTVAAALLCCFAVSTCFFASRGSGSAAVSAIATRNPGSATYCSTSRQAGMAASSAIVDILSTAPSMINWWFKGPL